jgi:hypothetical protein
VMADYFDITLDELCGRCNKWMIVF